MIAAGEDLLVCGCMRPIRAHAQFHPDIHSTDRPPAALACDTWAWQLLLFPLEFKKGICICVLAVCEWAGALMITWAWLLHCCAVAAGIAVAAVFATCIAVAALMANVADVAVAAGFFFE